MADEKSKDKSKDEAPPRDFIREGIEILLILSVLGSFLMGLSRFTITDPLFSIGWKNLNSHGITLAYTRPIASLFNPVGGNILVSENPSTAVLDDAGGTAIGTQRFGEKGVIRQGPVNVGGVNYYYVDFVNPPDGWVSETRIAYRDRDPSIFAKILLVIFKILTYVKYILWIGVLGLVFLIVRTIRNLNRVRNAHRETLYPKVENTVVGAIINPKWQRIMGHMESLNENDWRLAIIEADILLDELLDTMHLPGDSIGDKLKGVEKSDFTTLDQAWEAHKVRNQIAHDGSDFQLSQRTARQVIGLYEQVFKEFNFI